MNALHLITRSRFSDRYCLNGRELVVSDIVDFVDGGELIRGEVVHDGKRYMVITSWRILPLAEIVMARFVRRDDVV